MKVGIITDVHANIYGLESVLKELKQTEMILCAGDIVGYYPFVNEVFEMLSAYNVCSIKGNHDCYVLGELPVSETKRKSYSLDYTQHVIKKEYYAALNRLPNVFSEILGGVKIVMYHGSPWNHFEEYIYPDYQHFDRFQEIDADVIILGHTHYPLIKKIGEKVILNPGSCGQPRDYDPKASCAIFDTRMGQVEIRRCIYPIEKVSKKVKELGFSESLIRILDRTR